MAATTARTTGNIPLYNSKEKANLNVTNQLFGLPYHLMNYIDPPAPGVSDTLGRKFVENFILDAPIVTIIPGKPRYLPGKKDKTSYTNALVKAASGSLSELQTLSNNDPDTVKLYDFQSDYINYFQYVNILCRSCAGFLDLTKSEYKINGTPVNFCNYDWKNYRWNGKPYTSMTRNLFKFTSSAALTPLSAVISAATTAVKKNYGKNGVVNFFDGFTNNVSETYLETKENLLQKTNYIQFYVDTDNSSSMSVSNSTSQSVFKQALDGASGTAKDLAFLANSGGIDADSLQELGGSAIDALSEALGVNGTIDSTVGSIAARLLSSGKSIVKGENIMMPDIWAGSSNSTSYSLTVHLKALYGNRLSVYMDVIVPLMHLIALTFPIATGANSYKSPMLVKVYQKGNYTCNLGIVSDISISKNVSPTAWNVDGLCTEVDVTLSIQDLYSDIALSEANPTSFLNNNSLVEYLATTCGLDLIDSQVQARARTLWNGTINMARDLPSTVAGRIGESIDTVLASFIGL